MGVRPGGRGQECEFCGRGYEVGGEVERLGVIHGDPARSGAGENSGARYKRLQTESDYPSSDVLDGPNGYYVLHLAGSVPSRQLSFDEAKPRVVAQIQKDRATQLMQTKANDLKTRIEAALKSGKSFADAALAAGVKEENIPAFSLMTASKVNVPDIQAMIQTAVGLGDGKLSEFIPTEAGGLFVYMNRREPMNSIEAAIGGQMMKAQFARQKETGAFVEWLRLRKETARLQIFAQR